MRRCGHIARGTPIAVHFAMNALSSRSGVLAVFPVVVAFVACAGSDATSPPAHDGGTVDAGADGSELPDGGGCASDVPAAPGMLVTDRGPVRGALEGGAYAYRNIPFAAPPVGNLRWKPPAPAACWKEPRDGVAWGPMCPQSDETGTAPITGSEDCLQLNVFAPEGKSGPLPIMLWIHGGGNLAGSATSQVGTLRTYDAGKLAAKEGVIVVTTNYRLGALGFLAHPALAAEDPNRSEGNYALLDTIAALKWVKANAAAMGGDPAKVTIFGESAGAVNVCTLVASPLAKGLFAGAIMQSGGCVGKTRSEAEDLGAKVVAAAKCDAAADVLGCMRALSAEAVTSAFPIKIDVAGAVTGYAAVDDGYALVGKPLDAIKAGTHAKVPMIVGSNSDETSRSVPLAPAATQAQYEAAVRTLFPTATVADAVLAQYPATDYASPWAAYVALTTDAKFGCSARKTLRALRQTSTPAFRYYFSHALENSALLGRFGAFHGADVLYLFDHLNVSGYTPGAGDTAVVGTFTHRWASFAKNPQDPNGGDVLAWPAYDAATDPYLQIDSTITTGTGLRKPQCDFWEALLP